MKKGIILVVDDEPSIRDIVRTYLENEGFEVILAGDGREALAKTREEHPDLIVLDLMLPEVDGFEVCREIRKSSKVPIIMLTARGEEVDRVVGLEMGADDYVPKPFSPRELVARVKAVLRRAAPAQQQAEVMEFPGIRIDTASRKVFVDTREVSLAPKEYELLLFLANQPGRVFSREQILDNVWGFDYFGDGRTVDTHIKRLREKMGNLGHRYIKTVWGVGYKFEVEYAEGV